MLSRMRMISVFFICLLAAKTSSLAAQTQFTLEYPMTIPYGETADFIDETSYQGFGFTTFFPSQSPITLGMSFQWIGWDQEDDRGSYTENGATITGDETKEIDAYPLLILSRYEFARGSARPYVGLGAGVAYIEQYQRLGFAIDSDYSTQGILAPEVGVNVNVNSFIVGLGATYYDSFTAADPAQMQGLSLRLAMGVASF